MKCPSESTESLTSRLKVSIVHCVNTCIVASPSCLVELLLAIFWAVFTGFSCFLLVTSERGFLCLSNCKNL